MINKNKGFKTPSWSSPRGGKRGCLCENNTYSVKCCDGSLQAQGIGIIYKKGYPETFFILLENNDFILQENSDKLIKELNQSIT